MPFRVFAAGEVLTAANVNDYLAEQAVIACTSGTRPSSPNEGMTIYETDTDVYSVYNGSSWVRAVTIAAWETYTPSWTTTGTSPSVGNGTITGRYCHIGRCVELTITLTMGSTTTFGTGTYSFSVPLTASSASNARWVGTAYFRDNSAGSTGHFNGNASIAASGTTLAMVQGTQQVSETVPFTWAQNDFVSLSIAYEVAS
jgi:hypothetical protein